MACSGSSNIENGEDVDNESQFLMRQDGVGCHKDKSRSYQNLQSLIQCNAKRDKKDT